MGLRCMWWVVLQRYGQQSAIEERLRTLGEISFYVSPGVSDPCVASQREENLLGWGPVTILYALFRTPTHGLN